MLQAGKDFGFTGHGGADCLTEDAAGFGLAIEAAARCGPESSIARITAVDRGRYLIRGEADEVPAELTGRFLHLADSAVELPCVGDWVCVQYRDGGARASIHHVLPRRGESACGDFGGGGRSAT